MDPETKVIHHGATVIDTPPQGNPPPYTASGQSGYYPHPGYPAPGHQTPYGPNPGVQTTVMMTPEVIVTQQMGPRPTNLTCKSCHADVTTRVETKASTKTHLFALLLFFAGCWPCILLPYFMEDCMTANHYCPNCNSYLGSYIN